MEFRLWFGLKNANPTGFGENGFIALSLIVISSLHEDVHREFLFRTSDKSTRDGAKNVPKGGAFERLYCLGKSNYRKVLIPYAYMYMMW